MTKREKHDTLKEIEQNQELLKRSIDQSRQLADKAQTLLDKHRQETQQDA